MVGLTIVGARIAAFFVESVVLGPYLVTFVNTVYALFSTGSRWKRFGEVNHPIALVALFMFLNVMLGKATSLLVIWRAFILTPPGTAAVNFGQISYWAVVAKSGTLLFQTTIGDAMLIYRCWVVYSRSYLVVVFSIALWIGGTACAILILCYEATFKEHVLVSTHKLYPYGVAFWASTVALNIITTALLVWPIWRVSRRHEEYAFQYTTGGRANTMKHVMHVIIESGLLYTVVAFMTFVTYTMGSNSLYVVSAAEVGVAGIAFNLIIIRTSKATRTKVGYSYNARNTVPLHFIASREVGATTDDGRSQVRIVVVQETDQHEYARQAISGDIKQ